MCWSKSPPRKLLLPKPYILIYLLVRSDIYIYVISRKEWNQTFSTTGKGKFEKPCWRRPIQGCQDSLRSGTGLTDPHWIRQHHPKACGGSVGVGARTCTHVHTQWALNSGLCAQYTYAQPVNCLQSISTALTFEIVVHNKYPGDWIVRVLLNGD